MHIDHFLNKKAKDGVGRTVEVGEIGVSRLDLNNSNVDIVSGSNVRVLWISRSYKGEVDKKKSMNSSA